MGHISRKMSLIIYFILECVVHMLYSTNIKYFWRTEDEENNMVKEILMQRNLKYTIGILVPLLMVFLLFHFIIGTYKVPSASMENTIMTGDTVFANRLSCKFSDISYGDIIVFKKDGKGDNLIKRVIGLPGDEIRIYEGHVYRNGAEVVEDYVIGNTLPVNNSDYTVPENSVFVLGDNREDSNDSRYWNDPYVAMNDIIATAYFGFGFSPEFHIYYL